MFRTLLFQLIAIVVVTVSGVLLVSQAVGLRLSERTLERDLEERAALVVRTVDSLWGETEPRELRHHLNGIAQGDRDITAIDVFRVDGAHAELAVSTRATGEAPAPMPTAAEIARLPRGGYALTRAGSREGGPRWLLSAPLARNGVVAAVAQVEVWPGEVARLKRQLRVIDGAMLAASVLLISLLLTLFLQRRVSRPVRALVAGMQRAEGGDLSARVRSGGGGEFGFLTAAFNRMLGRIDELTTGLGERVRRATHDLAATNAELRAANDRLWQAQLEIGRSERLAALGQMAGTLAHELGTPLNSILGYVQLMRRGPLPAEQGERLAIVESQVRRMIEEIRSVLDRTRDVPRRRVPLAVADLVQEAVALVAARAAGRALQLTVDVPAGLPPLPGDAVGLRQALLNLLANAIDATAAGGSIAITAAAEPAGAPPTHVVLSVIDTGHGMSTDELRRAVEPFYTTKAPDRGSGLGLAIVDYIARAHGGTLRGESAPGRGTIMRLRLPLED